MKKIFLHEACAEQRQGSRVRNPVSASVLQGAVQTPVVTCGPEANLDLCLQYILMHGSAAGSATPKQPRKRESSQLFQSFIGVSSSQWFSRQWYIYVHGSLATRSSKREGGPALGQGVQGPQEVFWRRAAAAVQPGAALKTRVRFLFRRQAEEEYEEDMRRPADGGSSDGARCCRCAVRGASFFVCRG